MGAFASGSNAPSCRGEYSDEGLRTFPRREPDLSGGRNRRATAAPVSGNVAGAGAGTRRFPRITALDLVRGFFGANRKIIGGLAEAMNSPGTIGGFRNLIALGSSPGTRRAESVRGAARCANRNRRKEHFWQGRAAGLVDHSRACRRREQLEGARSSGGLSGQFWKAPKAGSREQRALTPVATVTPGRYHRSSYLL